MCQSSPEKAADRSNVGRQYGHKGERSDVVERNQRANVDKRKEAGYDEGHHDTVHWDVPARPDLRY